MPPNRILYAPPAGAPRRIQATTDRKGTAPAEEGDIPAYFLWDDGSEYEVWDNGDGTATRRYHGPMFSNPGSETFTFTTPPED